MTRMQAAIPIRVATASRAGGGRSNGIASGWPSNRARLLVVQFGGAAGTLDKLGDKADGGAQARWPSGSASPTRRNGTASATASPTSPAGCRW